MSLKEALSKTTRETLETYALNFSINIQKTLEETASKGESEYLLIVSDAHKNIYTSPIFLDNVRELLDGVNVDIVELSTNSWLPSIYGVTLFLCIDV